MSVCASRKSRHQIMANAGFGDLTIIKSDSVIVVPQKAINSNGTIKVRVQEKLNHLNLTHAHKLNQSYGITIQSR